MLTLLTDYMVGRISILLHPGRNDSGGARHAACWKILLGILESRIRTHLG